MLLLVHGQDGVQQAGQRDLVIAALLVVAVAFLLEAIRRDRWWYLAPFGLAVGLSATIKPTAGPLGVVLLVMAQPIARDYGEKHEGEKPGGAEEEQGGRRGSRARLRIRAAGCTGH